MPLLVRETKVLFLAAHAVFSSNEASWPIARRALEKLSETSVNGAIVTEARRLMANVPI